MLQSSAYLQKKAVTASGQFFVEVVKHEIA
jgi:hypothetical protein